MAVNKQKVKQDYLKEDPPIYGQDWVVVSLVAPENMVQKKNLYYTNNFVVDDINKTLSAQAMQMVKRLNVTWRNQFTEVKEKLESSIDEDDQRLAKLLNVKFKETEIDEDDFVDDCRRQYQLDDEEIKDRFKMYLVENRARLDRSFDEAHDHQTSIYGIKVRGSYQRYNDARDRAKYVRDEVEEVIHSFVAPVGKWLPVDFEADEIQDQEYMLEELNDLMGKYHENVQARNAHHRERKEEMGKNAHYHNSMSAKERLRKKMRERRNEKMRQELKDFEMSGERKTTITQETQDSRSMQVAPGQTPESLEAALSRLEKPKRKSKRKHRKKNRD